VMTLDYRQAVLDEIAEGYDLSEALMDARASRLTLDQILPAVKGVGEVRARKILARAGLAPWLRISQVTAQQRERLLKEME
jgi:ribosomal protein S13